MNKIIGILMLFGACTAVKVPVTIYYEALCPDSQSFINRQLYPVVKEGLKDFIDITWVPYGKSTHQTQGSEVKFNCHHGPNECYANKVHSCAIEHIQANSYEIEHTRESLTLDYLNCLMKVGQNFPDNKFPLERCAKENHVNNWDVILTCANSTEGDQLLKRNGELTDKFQHPLDSVPSIVFSHQFDKDIQEKALSNFALVACGRLVPRPKICEAHNNAQSLYIAPVLTIVALILSKLF